MRNLATLLAVVLLAGCGEGGGAAKGTPFDQLVAEGKPPVTVERLSRSMGPIPAFRCAIVNHSDRPVEAVTWVAFFTDANGAPVGEPAEGGYADMLSPVEPGSEIEGAFGAPSDEAVRARIVVKDLLYRKPNPIDPKLGDLSMKWTNPNFEAEKAAARGGS